MKAVTSRPAHPSHLSMTRATFAHKASRLIPLFRASDALTSGNSVSGTENGDPASYRLCSTRSRCPPSTAQSNVRMSCSPFTAYVPEREAGNLRAA